MKKAVPVLVVLAAIAAALFVYFKQSRPTFDLAPGFAADLAPPETVLFIEVPDVARTSSRWNETSLHAIAQEPEWKEFTAHWDDFVAQNDVAKDAFGVFGEVRNADPAGMFLAVTSIDATGAKLVGGFPYRGRKRDVENVVGKLRERIVQAWPAAKSEVTNYEGVEVETLKDPKFTAAMAYQDNWFFFATDTDLLLKTLSRYGKKKDAPAGLGKDPLWLSSQDPGAKEPDLRLWARWNFFADKLAALSAMAGQGVPQVTDPNPVQAVSYSWKLDGPMMRDRLFFQTTNPVKAEPYSGRLVAFTSPATYAYLGMSIAGLEEYTKSVLQTMATMGISKGINETLAPKGLKVEDVFTTFGPEIALMSAWEPGGIALPDLFVAVEVKDKVKARAFADFIAAEMGKQGPAEMTAQGETTLWSTGGDVPFFRPTVGINSQHLMLSLNATAMNAGIKQLTQKGPNLATQTGSPYPAALKTVVPPTAMLLYVDTKTLFERLYDKVKPMIAFSLVGNPEAGKHFDAAKIPQAGTISKHLAPMIVSYGADPKGWVVEATGSVSFVSTYMVAMPAAFLGLRAPQMVPPPATPSPAPPPAQTAPVPKGGPGPNPSPKPAPDSIPSPAPTQKGAQAMPLRIDQIQEKVASVGAGIR